MTNYTHLRAAGTSLILASSTTGLPRILHWGEDLGEVDEAQLEALDIAAVLPVISGTPDEPHHLSISPEQSEGWLATPGISGHRGGRDFSTAFAPVDAHVEGPGTGFDGAALAGRYRLTAQDPVTALELTWTAELLESGLLRIQQELRNLSESAEPFWLDTLDTILPLPRQAREILDFTGRHLKERSPQRHRLVAGQHLRESRRGRSHDGTLLMLAGEPGFTNTRGQVWGIHVAWSGNTRTFTDLAMPNGQAVIGAGELLFAGEVSLAGGQTYASPWVYAAYGDGLNALSERFHRGLRSRTNHPSSPRKALINVWEAVYFDHDLNKLKELADRAAGVGIERYVLDDGWFRGRRDDTTSLGDWYVDESVWPQGLTPIIEHVNALGMEFGLWIEPEMISEDSDLARAHPEWILRPPARMPRRSRFQQVLDLSNPEAWEYVHARIDEILSNNAIAFLKWDHNRDVFDAGQQATGRAGVHAQTEATYRLLQSLRRSHPQVEIESCSGGGGRADLGILNLTDRIWTSDCIDPLERQNIEAGTGLMLPPELIGSHIASPHSHTTGRRHDLSFRAATALFGHLGVEWDLTAASEEDLTELRSWIELYKSERELLHHGTVVRIDDPDPALRVHGVVSAERDRAIFAVVQLTTGVSAPPGQVRFAGLDPARRYRVRPLAPGDDPARDRIAEIPQWWASGGIVLGGQLLQTVGVQAPNQLPEHTVLIEMQEVSEPVQRQH